MRYLLRLAKDLNLLTVDSYGHAAERVEEIGRMVGGWWADGGRPAWRPSEARRWAVGHAGFGG